MAERFEDVIFHFDGGLASLGQMHLYEYSRSQYGLSRILTAVEQFRRTGRVIEKVTKNQRVGLLVSVPREGSFELQVKVAVRDAAETYFKDIDFDTLFALVLDKLIPKGEEHFDLVRNLAKIQHDEGLPDGEWKEILAQVADGQPASSQDALKIIDYALRSKNPEIGRKNITYDRMRRAQIILESDCLRQSAIGAGKKEIDKIDFDSLNKLVAKVRPIFDEVAVPLNESATSLSIGAKSNPGKYYHLDRERLDHIQSRVLDETEEKIRVRIKSYDRESGTGRMRSDEFFGVKSFQVDPEVRDEVQPEIIHAMNRGAVDLTCARYTDRNGVVTSYVVRSVD